MAAQCCTSRVLKKWGCVSFGEKLGEKERTSAVVHHVMPQLHIVGFFSYIFILESVGLFSVNVT